jgi:hypothetical protein
MRHIRVLQACKGKVYVGEYNCYIIPILKHFISWFASHLSETLAFCFFVYISASAAIDPVNWKIWEMPKC